MIKYNHAIGIAFEFIANEEDPITKDNLPLLIDAIQKRLASVVENETVDAFDVYDTYKINKV